VQEAVQRISEGLAARGHLVTVATTYHSKRDFKSLNGVTVEQFDVRGKWMRGFHGEVGRYKQFVRSFGGDVMMNYAAQQWSADLVFPLLDRLTCVKVFVPCGYSTLYNWKWWLYFRRLPSVLGTYDHVVYLSDNYRDKQFGDRHGIKHFSIIGNGAAEEEFQEPRCGFRSEYGITTTRMFLCVSNYGPGKNQGMVLRAYQEANVPDSTLVFIGFEFNDYTNKLQSLVQGRNGAVRFLEHVPREKVVAVYHEADLFLFGSLLECFPLVILEAMASRTPFISTNVGCVNSLPGGVVVSSVEEMAKTLAKLAQADEDWKILSEAGRKAWEKNYRWDKIVDQYEALYMRVFAG
jgi:glycosyltransferase involved in cell wall biosynthesis